MNIINKLTLRHMLLNKKRTVVTILGIIISVAMFTGVTTFATSFMKMMQIEGEQYSGDWQVSYHNVDKDKITILQEDSNTKDISTMYKLDATLLNNLLLEDNYAPGLDIYTLDQQTFKKALPLKDGDYPTNEQEIVIPEYLNQGSLDLKVGDKITVYGGYADLPLDPETNLYSMPNDGKEHPSYPYTITGISDSSYLDYQSTGLGLPCYTYTTTNTIAKSIGNISFVSLHSITNDIYDNSETLAKEIGINNDSIKYNNTLIYYGVSSNNSFLTVMYTIVLIIMSIIMIGAIALIYNAFAISLSERSKYLGMLSSIGATKNQKRQSVFFEGLCLGILSIPLGVVCGIGGLGLTFAYINPIIKNIIGTSGFPLTISYQGIVLAVAFAIVTILISTYIPARRASKISPIEAMRASKDIKITNKTVKTNGVIKKVFGFEGELAMKNLKRNKKRYYITVISLTVSTILFLSVSGFTYYMKQSFTMSSESLNYDLVVNNPDDALLEELQNVKNAKEIGAVKELYLDGFVKSDTVNPEVLDYLDQEGMLLDVMPPDSDEYHLTIRLLSYGDRYLKDFYQQNNLTFNPDKIVFDQNNIISMKRKYKEISIIDFSKKSFTYSMYSGNRSGTSPMTFNNYDTITSNPIGSQPQRAHYQINGYISDKIYESFIKEYDLSPYSAIYMKANDKDALGKEIKTLLETNDSGHYYNMSEETKRMDQLLLVINVFMYGFILLISLISIANIFNTITTSVALRTKEFAMLKSVGMTPSSFNKMVYFESLFYGLNTLLFGLPIGLGIMYWMHMTMNSVFSSTFSFPISSFIIVIIAIFTIVGSTLLYSTNKIKKQNIIDGLKEENI